MWKRWTRCSAAPWGRRRAPIEIKKCEFLRSAADPKGYAGLTLPQIALAGRSNVGKSSLINALTGRKGLAKISATPGKTRLINFFVINDRFILTDLPGYGFARVSGQEQRKWGPMIEQYLLSTPNLKHLFLLLDIRREPTDDDRQMAYWAQHYAVPCTIVATKADKITRSQWKLRADTLSDALGMTFRTATVVFSSKDGAGRDELLRRMDGVLSADDCPG